MFLLYPQYVSRTKAAAPRPDLLKFRGPVKIYAGYTRCDHCGIYDRDPLWCELCGKSKHAGRMKQPRAGANEEN